MEEGMDQVALVVLDGVGCGEAADIGRYPEDSGANSLLHAAQMRRFEASALQSMGLEHIRGLEELNVAWPQRRERVRGAFGALEPTFAGNGSPEGHQALMGHVVGEPYRLFNRERIPLEIVALVEDAVQRVTERMARVIRYPGTDDVSGTVFIEHPDIGPVHLRSRNGDEPLYVPIYASSDSLIQIALHQGVVPQSQIEAIGKMVRGLLDAEGYRVGRVIMRPFVGEPGSFKRVSADRRDYGVDPDGPTLIDHLSKAKVPVFGVGKAADMVNKRGFPEGSSNKLKTDSDRINAVLGFFRARAQGFLFANLVGTDEEFGHRRDAPGYVAHINGISAVIGEIQKVMGERALLLVSSDHGNDPTHKGHTNHTRERVPLLVFSPKIDGPVDLGVRGSFADVAQTIAEAFRLESGLVTAGESFLGRIS